MRLQRKTCKEELVDDLLSSVCSMIFGILLYIMFGTSL